MLALAIKGGDSCRLEADPAFGKKGWVTTEEPLRHVTYWKDRAWASSDKSRVYGIAPGKENFACTVDGYLEIHPSGSWGIAIKGHQDVPLVEMSDTGCRSKVFPLMFLPNDERRVGPFKMISAASVTKDGVIIGGVGVGEGDKAPRIVAVFDKAGDEKLRLQSKGPSDVAGFSWVHAVGACKTGFCVIDSNQKQLSLWAPKTGTHKGNVALGKLLGAASAWISNLSVAPDGKLYVTAALMRGATAEGFVVVIQGI